MRRVAAGSEMATTNIRARSIPRARRISSRKGILHLQLVPETTGRRTPDGVFADPGGVVAYDAKTMQMAHGRHSTASGYGRIRAAIEDAIGQIRMQVGWEGRGEVHLALRALTQNAGLIRDAFHPAHRDAARALPGVSLTSFLTAYGPDGSIFLETSSDQSPPSGSR